jgi:hypothetical protein
MAIALNATAARPVIDELAEAWVRLPGDGHLDPGEWADARMRDAARSAIA